MIGRWLATGLALSAGAYASWVAVTWLRYGEVSPSPSADDRDALLDRFMPVYEVVERHQVRVGAPAGVTFAAAREEDLLDTPLVRALVRTRELVLGGHEDDRPRPQAFLARMQSLGWGVLAEVPGREIVAGAVTKPWEANVIFRPLPPEAFAAFDEPGFVKIVWTLRADPAGATDSIFSTETRALPTDPISRARFRRYWAFVSPGVVLIRYALLGPLKAAAERRHRERRSEPAMQVRSEAS